VSCFFLIFDLMFVLNLFWIRSFGLMLGLLNKPRLVSKEMKNGKEIEKHHITSLLLVPHRELAFKLYRIVDRIIYSLPKARAATMAYVLVRGTGVPIDRQLRRLEETPPHILICTPKALLDVYKAKSNSLKLSTLSTIAVDDMEALIETVSRKEPKKPYKRANDKTKRKTVRHPGLARQFLNGIYSKRRDWDDSPERTVGGKQGPQLILLSATLRVHSEQDLFEKNGWLDKDNLIKIFKDDERQKMKKKKVQKAGHSGVTGKQGTVLHSVQTKDIAMDERRGRG
jgi:superfamily II DNA/RNA helicase